MESEEVIRVAKAMRKAYGGEGIVSWKKAGEAQQRAWLICARAAVDEMEKIKKEGDRHVRR